MPKIKGIYENGVIRPLEKIDLVEKEEVEIVYGETAGERQVEKRKVVTVKASELPPLVGIFSVGGDAVEDAEKYYE